MADSSLPELSLDLGDALAVCQITVRKQHVGSKEPFWFAAANQSASGWTHFTVVEVQHRQT